MNHVLQNCEPTSTGNQMSYRYSWDLALATPTWEIPIGPDSAEDVQHAEAIAYDREHFPPIHIHWETSSRDCDGGHGDYGIYWARKDERFVDEESGEIEVFDFWRFHLGWLASPCAFDGTLQVTADPYDPMSARAEWHETTDEGFSAKAIYLCADDCETPRNTVYDQFAQEAGY